MVRAHKEVKVSSPLGGPLRGWRQRKSPEPRGRRDEGFTLIELMVVVLIIAILIAIAVPTFLVARQRAQNRTTQTDVRHALGAEKTYYADSESYTADPAVLAQVLATATFAGDQPPAVPRTVYVAVLADGSAVLGARSASGQCFYVKDEPMGAGAGTKYGQEDPGAGVCSAPSAAVVAADKWT